jgi:2-isopropylmalate synthase
LVDFVDDSFLLSSAPPGTGAITRVLVRTSDGDVEWDTVGVDENVIAASWQALADAYTFGLLRSVS